MSICDCIVVTSLHTLFINSDFSLIKYETKREVGAPEKKNYQHQQNNFNEADSVKSKYVTKYSIALNWQHN